MMSLIEQIKNGKLWRYLGGVHPKENKTQSTSLAITTASIPKHLIIPVKQHIGQGGQIIVASGDRVLKGQPLTASDSFMAVPIHAPTSGTIEHIAQYPSTHPSATPEIAIKLVCDQEDQAMPAQPALDYKQLSTSELQQHISQAGVAGMGGAGFPTAVKLNDRQPIEFLLINAAECEPYITSDDVLMRERADDIIQGIEILRHMIKPALCVIGIEDNKPDAAQALETAINKINLSNDIIVRKVPTKYPNGGEKQLIQMLTGKEISKGQIPAQSGIVMQNVGTVYAVKQAIIDRQPLLSRIVTLTGKAFPQPRNVQALIGTPISALLSEFHCDETKAAAIIYGGPMMGFTLPHTQFSLTKTGNCILTPVKDEIPQVREADACIRCGECSEVCPVDLLPQQLHWYSQAKDVKKLNDYNLMDCIECGACSYVCPSQIPLVHQYRIAKVEVRANDAELAAAAIAKERFEKRNERLALEKAQREQRQKEAAEKRRATAKATTGEDPVKAAMDRIKKAKAAEQTPANGQASKGSAVADAIARAKAKKAAAASTDTAVPDTLLPNNAAVIAERKARKAAAKTKREAEGSEQVQTTTSPAIEAKKAAVAEAIARAKAKKAATQSGENATDTPAPAVDAKNAAVAAAIARAKAKKAAAQSGETATDTPTPAVDVKKAAVAAAIARAKAKKIAAKLSQSEATESTTEPPAPAVDAKKAAIAAAIARAKAKKAAALSSQTEAAVTGESTIDTPAPTVDAKKAAVAAAIARAKAKKAAAQSSQTETAEETTEPPAPAVDAKKAAIAAAIARAKAKKAAAQSQSEATESTTESPAPVVDAKKAAIAAAVARAKAKKAAAQPPQSEATESTTESPAPVVDAKKAAIAAAVARAKAKKAATKETPSTQNDTIEIADSAAPAVDNKKAAIAAVIAKAKAKKLAQLGDK
ncbi:electron transport complex protein RnfC [Moritella sp. PE36]|uniref:electron transport complex subunit RsxC n=1 Tax=Moritella sp. PE36 TaxID=58051 RepID=UPI0001569413|nr:electron transport complex subunit RsxC [Moritella sp. PE36]EDM64934.1 electron transport complex protein RnfC [Moritella sp. PE36]